MSDSDQLTESPELRRLADSWSGVSVPEPPPLDTIMAGGRARQQRRLYGVGLFLVAAGIAAALIVGPTGAPGARPRPGAPATLTTFRTAAYTIVLNRDATATLTINPTELIDSAKLQSDLDRSGIPAIVRVGSFCTSDPAPSGLSQVVSYQSGERDTITIDPTAMPPGTELSFGEFELPLEVEMASFGLIDKASYTCSSALPTSPSHGAMYLMRPHAP